MYVCTQAELDDALAAANLLREQNKALMDELAALRALMADMVPNHLLAEAKVCVCVRACVCVSVCVCVVTHLVYQTGGRSVGSAPCSESFACAFVLL